MTNKTMINLRAGRVWTSFLFLMVLGVVGLAPAQATAQTTCYAVNGGSWSDANTWAGSSTANGGTCSGSNSNDYPNGSDDAVITSGVSVTQDLSSLSINSVTVNDNATGLFLAEDLSVANDVEVGSSAPLKTYTSSNGVLQDSGLLSVGGTLTNDGTVEVDRDNSGTGELVVSGVFTNNSSGTVDVDKLDGGPGLLSAGALKNEGDIQVYKSEGTITCNGFLNNNPNSTGATLNIGTGTLEVSGNLSNGSGGSFTANSSGGVQGTVIFTSGSTASPTLSGNWNGSNSFYDVEVESGSSIEPDDALTVGGSTDAPQIDGELKVFGQWGEAGNNEGADLIFQGDLFQIDSNGDFFSNKVQFNNGGSTDVEGTVFSDVTVTNNTEVDLKNQFTINGKLTITGTTGDALDLTTGVLTLNGDAQIEGKIKPNNGGVTFNSGSTQTIEGSTSQQITTGNTTISNGAGNTTVEVASASAALVTRNLNLQSGTELRLGRPLQIEGDFTNTGGAFDFLDNATSEKITLNGGGPQTIDSSSDITLNELEVANLRDSLKAAPDVKVTDGSIVSVADKLIMTSGRLETSDDLRLLPGARIVYNSTDGDGNGTLDSYITDNVVSLRTLRGSSDWVNVSAPATTTYAEYFEEQKTISGDDYNDLWIQGPANSDIPGADTSGRNTVNLFYYNESGSVNGSTNNARSGWTAVGDMTNSISRTRGLLLYPYVDDNNDGTESSEEQFPKRIDVVGGANFTPTTTISLSATDQGNNGISGDSDDGWNLISNPYLNTIDWTGSKSGNGVDSTNCCGVIYTYDASNDSYISHNGTVTSTGNAFADYGYVAPHQSFFVKATSTSSSEVTIDITEDQVADSSGADDPFIPKSSSQREDRLVSLQLQLSSLTADAHASFQSGGERGFDRRDAYQLNPPLSDGGFLELYSVLRDGTGLAISNLPRDLDDDTSVPFAAISRGCAGTQPFGGTATMRWPELRNLPYDWNLTLEDTKTDTKVNLQKDSTYTFTLESSTPESECASKSFSEPSSEQRPPLPSPEVATHPSVKAGTAKDSKAPRTRFNLHIKPNAVPPAEVNDLNTRIEDQDAILEWTTPRETNNAGFQVQRKADGSYSDVGGAFVESKADGNTSTQKHSYQYRVEDLDAGSHTYRLKMVDTDGEASFTDPIDVEVGVSGKYDFTTYPNPVRERATVKFALEKEEEVSLVLYNTLGQRVRTVYRDTPPAGETEDIRLDTDGLSSGLYILRLKGPGITATQRVTVVK